MCVCVLLLSMFLVKDCFYLGFVFVIKGLSGIWVPLSQEMKE